MATDEILDLVDINDVVIGRISRRDAYARDIRDIRVINAFLINSQGQIWIPRRTASKALFPLALDMSVGGHVESGETYESTLMRETMEELNLDLAQVPFREVAYLSPKDGVHAHMKVYEIQSDIDPDYNRDDFIEANWMSPQDVIKAVSSGEKAKGDLVPLCKIIYGSD